MYKLLLKADFLRAIAKFKKTHINSEKGMKLMFLNKSGLNADCQLIDVGTKNFDYCLIKCNWKDFQKNAHKIHKTA